MKRLAQGSVFLAATLIGCGQITSWPDAKDAPEVPSQEGGHDCGDAGSVGLDVASEDPFSEGGQEDVGGDAGYPEVGGQEAGQDASGCASGCVPTCGSSASSTGCRACPAGDGGSSVMACGPEGFQVCCRFQDGRPYCSGATLCQ